MPVSSLPKVGELVREQRHILLARWSGEVRQLPSAKDLDVPTLNDHIPYLIDELAERSGRAVRRCHRRNVLLEGSPPAHGRQRLHDGFDIEEVVAEYNVLRGCLHELAEENGIVIHGNDPAGSQSRDRRGDRPGRANIRHATGIRSQAAS